MGRKKKYFRNKKNVKLGRNKLGYRRFKGISFEKFVKLFSRRIMTRFKSKRKSR